MPIGPRLDRPSSVGNEGRARETSLGIVTIVVLAVAAGFGYVSNSLQIVQQLAVGISLVGFGIGLFNRESVSSLFIGHLCFLLGGLLVSRIVSVLIRVNAGLGVILMVLGIAIALLGVAGGWANTIRDDSLMNATKQGWGAFFVPVVLFFILSSVIVGLFVMLRAFGYVLSPSPSPSLSGLLFLIGVLALSIRVSLPRLPITQLAARENRPEIEAKRDWWLDRSRYWIAAGFGSAVLVATAELSGYLDSVYAGIPRPLAAFLASPIVRVPVLGASLLLVAAAGIAVVVYRMSAGLEPDSVSRYGPVLGGIILLTLPIPIIGLVLPRIGQRPGTTQAVLVILVWGLILVLAGVFLFLLLFSIVPLFSHFDLLPDRAGAPALTSVGLLFATLGVALSGTSAPLVFVGAAATMLVWDVSEFGTRLTAELGHVPKTRRLELLHGILSLGVAAVAVVTLIAIDAGVQLVAPSGAVVPAMLFSVAGVLVLLTSLRG